MKFYSQNSKILIVVFLSALFHCNFLTAQTFTFDYTSGLSSTTCNQFDPAVVEQGYTHTTFAGSPHSYGTYLSVPASYSTLSNVLFGTGYAISYPFSTGHGYAISVTASATINNSSAPYPNMRIGVASTLPTTSSVCGSSYISGYNNTANLSFPTIYNTILSASNSIQVPFFTGLGESLLLIGTYPNFNTTSYFADVRLSSISISEVPPITPSSALICSGSSQVFSVNTPYPVSWTSSPTGVLSISPSGLNNRDLTATATTNSGNLVTLTASVTTPNGVVNLTRQVVVGVPIINLSSSQSGSCYNGYQSWLLNASSPSSATSWNWTVDNPSSGSWYIASPYSSSTYVDVAGGGGVSVEATNVCGTKKNGVTIYSNCGSSFGLKASPNPASDKVSVSIAESQNAKNTNKQAALIYQIKVLDQMANIKKTYKFSGISNATISLGGLLKGTYTIQAFDGFSWRSVQVLKQ
ncbi:MAG: hypothetical protein ABI151_17115 [Chitinophagaceae bacterium]